MTIKFDDPWRIYLAEVLKQGVASSFLDMDQFETEPVKTYFDHTYLSIYVNRSILVLYGDKNDILARDAQTKDQKYYKSLAKV